MTRTFLGLLVVAVVILVLIYIPYGIGYLVNHFFPGAALTKGTQWCMGMAMMISGAAVIALAYAIGSSILGE